MITVAWIEGTVLLQGAALRHDAVMNKQLCSLWFFVCLSVTSNVWAQKDVSVAMMSQPLSGCSLGAEASVKLHLFNHGEALPAGSVIELSYTIDGSNAVRESWTLDKTLLQDSAIAHEFLARADLSAPGSYAFSATVNLKDDANPLNNTLKGHRVVHWAPSDGGKIHGPARATSGSLLLREMRGQVTHWEQSSDAGASWDTIDNATATFEFSDLLRSTLFRAEVRNGSCAPVYSAEWIVAPE